MAKPRIFTQSRRHFLSNIALLTLGLMAKDWLYPSRAFADSSASANNTSTREIYHIFVPYAKARRGGQQIITLRSGDTQLISIPAGIRENQEKVISGVGLGGEDIVVVFHTLYDRITRIGSEIYEEIEKTKFIEQSSQEKCKSVYDQVEDSRYMYDLIALELLDYVISSSKIDPQIQQRYEIASKNSRLVGIEKAIASALAESNLTEKEKKTIRGTYEYVRAGEPVPDFKALTDLDTIITNSTLPLTIQQIYSLASATSRALTVDFILVNLIKESQKLSPGRQEEYLAIYDQVRSGETISESDVATLTSLDSFIEKANIPENAKVVYFLTRQQDSNTEVNFTEKVSAFIQDADALQEQLEVAKNRGGAVVPQATKLLTQIGAETATGVSISSLSGAAATNATLAFLGGGSVAAGGLGMLGGLVVATGGAALIGAAGLVSVALVSQMDSQDLTNLGVAITTGTLVGGASVFAAWTAASALGIASSLSGAAAISATMSVLGGLSVMTGGAALVASATAVVIWSFLEGGKRRDGNILRQLETRIYTLTKDPTPDSIGELLQEMMGSRYGSFLSQDSFSAPNIPLGKLSNSLSTWLLVDYNEKVLSLIDTSIFKDAKNGIAFTDRRITWKEDLIQYQDLAKLSNREFLYLLSNYQDRNHLRSLINFVETSPNPKDYENLVRFFNVQLGELLSNKQDAKKLFEFVELVKTSYENSEDYQVLVKFVDPKLAKLISNEQTRMELFTFVDVVNKIFDDRQSYDYLAQFFNQEFVEVISNSNNRQDLSKLIALVEKLNDEQDQNKFVQILKEIAQKYSLA
ncbi:hypothetical protein M595_5789 [Lyngbya aestuarii BL J]|uniref:Uncharacterized protein n=2 Tax=Lyngbya aestuarii BL J TaxID=1348334 RepID=U7QAN8_9CYAN|nr:hypothetical protein [Lyngbya aestuarii]ERT04267.1 hypothetical protein M595_5789 [Lyngbya aestuarii BL J]